MEEIIKKDFDRIACVKETRWDHNLHYHKYLQKFIPAQMEAALDIGCGTGTFSRLLAKKANCVIGIDLSPEMIKRAESISKGNDNIDYRIENVMEYSFEENKYDCIVSIATMHHLPFQEVLEKIKKALRPGGVLLILDLYKHKSVTDLLLSLAAAPVNLVYTLLKTGRLRKSREEIEAWVEHGKHDKYMTIDELRAIYCKLSPGAILKRHLFWRYSLVWKKL